MVSEMESIRAWFEYVADARRGYLDVIEKLPAAELARDRGASYPTLLDLFAHTQGGLYYWMKNCATAPFPPQQGDEGAPLSVAVLRTDEAYVQARIQEFVARLSEVELDRLVSVPRDHPTPHECRIPVREVFWHLVEEELQHRGELNALLWQMDVEPPVRDWLDWAHDVGRIRDSASK